MDKIYGKILLRKNLETSSQVAIKLLEEAYKVEQDIPKGLLLELLSVLYANMTESPEKDSIKELLINCVITLINEGGVLSVHSNGNVWMEYNQTLRAISLSPLEGIMLMSHFKQL
jgi:hypothetical protein